MGRSGGVCGLCLMLPYIHMLMGEKNNQGGFF